MMDIYISIIKPDVNIPISRNQNGNQINHTFENVLNQFRSSFVLIIYHTLITSVFCINPMQETF